MKIATTLITLTLTIAAWGQGTINWEQEIIVSDGSLYGNFRPRATVVGNTPVVIYGRTGTENLFVSRWNGTGFDTQPILPSGTSTYIASWTGPDIASTEDTVIAVFKLNPSETGNVYVVRSTDGGVTFSDTMRVNNYTGGNAWMPSMEMRADGNPVVSMMIHDGNWSNPRYALAHSNDGGMTFGAIEEVATSVPGEACDCCPSEVVVDGSREVLLFRNNDGNIREVFGVMSNDGGQSFPFTENLDQLAWNISVCPSTGVDGVFMNNDLYMVYASAAGGIYRVYVSKSNANGGLTLDTVQVMADPDPANGIQNYPTISGVNDTLVMAWEERINFNKEIYYSVAVPGVDPMHALTTYKFQANETTTGNQTNPEIIYQNGFVHLFYQDDGSGDLIYRRGTVDVNLGLDANSMALAHLAPNPSQSGTGTVMNARKVVKVTSITGKNIVFDQNQAGNRIQLQLSDVTPGIYFVHGTDVNGTDFCTRWVIQ